MIKKIFSIIISFCIYDGLKRNKSDLKFMTVKLLSVTELLDNMKNYYVAINKNALKQCILKRVYSPPHHLTADAYMIIDFACLMCVVVTDDMALQIQHSYFLINSIKKYSSN